MSIEQSNPEQLAAIGEIGEQTEQNLKSGVEDMERARRNISALIDSGKLPSELAERLAKLQLSEQIETLQEQTEWQQEQSLIKKAGKRVDFGVNADGRRVTMSVLEPQAETWTPKFYPAKNNRYFNVGFISNTGLEFIDPTNSQATTDDDLANPEVQAAVEIERRKLNMHLEREKAKRHISPEKREEFKETEYSVEIMQKIADLLNRQESLGRGLLIVEGEAGTGKNWMLDHIAHLTERPIFRFTCDGSKETPELKYILEFVTDEKGARTQRRYSTIIEALQTEGAILELDEINTLRPDIAKSLNSLFDADRALYFGEDDLKVKAARGVLMIGLMNPSHYAGVKPLAETIVDRARIIKVDYPPLRGEDKNGDPIILSDEAEMIFQYFPEFHGLQQSDFRMLWHQKFNGRESKEAQNLSSQARDLRLTQLKTLIAIASHIREAYRQYQEEGSSNMINYNFTLRGSVDCAMKLSQLSLPTTEQEAENQVRTVITEIFIPKLREPEEKKNVEALIKEV